MMDDLLVIVGFAIFFVSIAIFFLIPDSIGMLAFSGLDFFKGQVWRIFSFSFVHVDLVHLIGNMIALGIVGLLAYELHFSGKHFLLAFFLTAILIAIVEGITVPAVVMAGASLGLYAVIGGLVLKSQKYLPKQILILLVMAGLVLNYMFSTPNLSGPAFVQTVFHFIGFLVGMALMQIILNLEKEKIKFFSCFSK